MYTVFRPVEGAEGGGGDATAGVPIAPRRQRQVVDEAIRGAEALQRLTRSNGRCVLKAPAFSSCGG
jgi:hypothetical protein